MGRRHIHTLSDAECKGIKEPGLHRDGGGLYLRVTRTLAKNWIFRYRRRDMGLGGYPEVTLSGARKLAADARKLLSEGKDPIDDRRANVQTETAAPAETEAEVQPTMTFSRAAGKYIQAHAPGWKHPKHLQQWENSLRNYAEPIIGAMNVAEIERADVIRVLQPIWATKIETARRLRARIESVLDWAMAEGYRTTENPARWDGRRGLENSLPAPSTLKVERNFAALPYEQVPNFMAQLVDKAKTEIAASALRFTVLTAARTREAIGARWDEVDFDAGLWTIAGYDPVTGRRMKNKEPHMVPLARQALEFLRDMMRFRQGDHLFPGTRRNQSISEDSMLKALDRIGLRGKATTHGFRASFKTWASEETDFDTRVVEMSLAHKVGNKTERAYLRTKLLPKRRLLMQAWADFCTSACQLEPVPAEPAVAEPTPVMVTINGHQIEVSPTDPLVQRWMASLGVGRRR